MHALHVAVQSTLSIRVFSCILGQHFAPCYPSCKEYYQDQCNKLHSELATKNLACEQYLHSMVGHQQGLVQLGRLSGKGHALGSVWSCRGVGGVFEN